MEAPDPIEDCGPMEGTHPWKVRDRVPSEMDRCSEGTAWAQWKAAALNKLFQEQGVTGKPGRITAATVQHGEWLI